MSTDMINQLSISAWNVHGLGDKVNDDFFIDRITCDINILIETWKGESSEYSITGFNTISKVRKKKKGARRHSGGIIIYYKKYLQKGLTYIKNGTSSNNRMWLKLEKTYFGLSDDIYICAIYIPPIGSNHYDNDFLFLEEEISHFSSKGKLLLIGDFNSRTGEKLDFIESDSKDLNNFVETDLLPDDYKLDNCFKRNNGDHI